MFVNNENLVNSLSHFGDEGPFDHCIIDDFFEGLSYMLSKELVRK